MSDRQLPGLVGYWAVSRMHELAHDGGRPLDRLARSGSHTHQIIVFGGWDHEP